MWRHPPLLGEYTDEGLTQPGYDEQPVEDRYEQGVLGDRPDVD